MSGWQGGELYFFYINGTDSTQNHSKALSTLHSNSVTFWIQSAHQTQGRGQRGRNWTSSTGNLFLTGCFIQSKKISAGQLSISIGVTLSEILQSLLPKQQVELKWPNDVLLNKKKCAGILIEIDNNIYIGIGVNIKSHPEDTSMPATHLQAWGSIDTNTLVSKIIEHVPDFEALENFEQTQQAWWSLAKNCIPYWQVREPIQGTIIGIDEQGQLLIKSENGQVIKRHQTFE